MQHTEIERLKFRIAEKANKIMVDHEIRYEDIEVVSNAAISKIQNYHLDKVGLGQIIVYYEAVTRKIGEPMVISLSFIESGVALKV